jgi:autotransporter-associated beta strand protein
VLVSSRMSRLRALITTAAVVVAGVAVVGVAAPAQAAGTSTWTGASSTLWSDPDNWGGVAPVAGADLVFPADAAGTTAVNDFAAGTSFGELSIDGPGYAIAGNAVTLTVGLATTYASGTSVIGLDVSGSGSLTVGGGGVLEVNGAVTGPVVLTGGTLSGTGTLNGSGITGSSDSTVDPGPSGGSGILRYSANTALNLPAYSTYHVDLDGPTLGTGYDQVRLTSGSALFNPNNATLDVSLGYLPAVNTSFQVVSQTFGSPITGRFNGISQFGSVISGPVTFSVGYFNSGVILTVIAVNVPTRTWDGGGTTNNWSDAANWVGDVAPSFAAALVFPAGAAKLASVNDLEPGLQVTSLTVGASGYVVSGAPIDLLGTARATYVSGTSSIDLGLDLDATRTVEVDAGGTLLLGSPVSGGGGLTKTSAGILRVTGVSNSYTGPTAINAGRLVVDGSIVSSSSLQVAAGASLGGDGAVPTVAVSGRLVPSVLSTGSLTLNAGAELAVGLAETGHDEVDVAGTVQLSSPTLSASLDYEPALGDTFTIVDNDGSDAVDGTFDGLPESATLQVDDVTLQISYVGGSGNDVVLTTTVVPTTTTVTSSKPTTVTGEPVTFTATTATAADDVAVPSGAVRFLIGGDQVQAATAVDEDGQVTFTTSSLPVGDTTVVAEYTSSTGYRDSDGDYLQTVGVAGASTTLTVPDGPFVSGESVDLSAAVSATAPGGGTPAGDVEFYDGATLLGTESLDDSGVATWTTSDLAAGPHSLTAVYEGGNDHTTSTSVAVERTVVKRTSTVTVTSGPSTTYGEGVTFTATVTDAGTAVPGGTVRFLVGDTEVQPATAVDANGRTTFTTSTLPVGDTTVTAEYTGTATLAASNGSRTHTVSRVVTTTTLRVTATSLTATVTPAASGTVAFTANGTPVGTSPLVAGVATLVTTLAPGKAVTVVATYAGSETHSGSTASVLRSDPAITARLTSSRPSSKFGWYRTPVTVSFTCTAGAAALNTACPAAVVLDRSGRGQSVQRTITSSDGGAATAAVQVNIDRKAPSLRVKRTGNRLRCKARDSLSGIATCKVRTKTRAGGVVTWVAKATDRAGNVTTRRGHYRKR